MGNDNSKRQNNEIPPGPRENNAGPSNPPQDNVSQFDPPQNNGSLSDPPQNNVSPSNPLNNNESTSGPTQNNESTSDPPENNGSPSDPPQNNESISDPPKNNVSPSDPPQNNVGPSSDPSQNSTPSSPRHHPKKKLDRWYSRIADNYDSLQEVTDALKRAGLKSSNLIVGIDFTKSNEWTGKRSYDGRSLHHIGDGLNPYEQAISIIGKTLATFDDDNLIPCFGFGDASTHDQDVFSFSHDDRFCNGFEEVLSHYREIVPNLQLAGPTSFAPIVEMAMTIVEQSVCQYHVLLIIADGQVTRTVDTEKGKLSPQEKNTIQALVEASKFPLSIILVGVGDGPWDMMRDFDDNIPAQDLDDNIPARDFDNFQFVNFTEIMSKNVHQSRKETEFALSALMEIPSQYKATIELNLLGQRKGNTPKRVALPPPVYGMTFSSSPNSSDDDKVSASAAPSAPSSTNEHQICPLCLSNPKDMAFGCGHQTCCKCGQDLPLCPICCGSIEIRIKLI